MDTSGSTVFVVDDDEGMRDALCCLIRSVQLKVEAYRSAQEFLENYREQLGVLIVDVRMPGMNGLALQDLLISTNATLAVIFISAYAEVAMVVKAMRSGAMEFLEKPFSPQKLLATIEDAFKKSAELHAERERCLADMRNFETLTPREREVMQCICDGKSGKATATALDISYKTVEKFRAQALRKMNAVSTLELALIGARLNITKSAEGTRTP